MHKIRCIQPAMGTQQTIGIAPRRAISLVLGCLPAVCSSGAASASQLEWSVVPTPWAGSRSAAPLPAAAPMAAPVAIPITPASRQASLPAPPRFATTSASVESPRKTQPTPRPAQTARIAQAANTTTPATSATSPEAATTRQNLLIPPLVTRRKPWPAPSLSPGVPSSFIANWGDVFIGASAATAGKQRGGTADGSWSAGFGLGDAAKAVAVEFSGGCGSVNNFCANGSFDVKVSRLLLNQSTSRLAISGAWQNFAQWGNEGKQDNTFYGGLTYAMPLNPNNKAFERTLQINAGVGNSRYAPYSATDSENQIGAFASVGVELAPNVGISAGWSGRGANAQFSITPFRDVPISLNLLGADLFNQTPAGTVGVLSISWGANFRTASFE